MVYALLIDDDSALTQAAKVTIEAEGLHIEIASSWEEGLAKFYAYSPDVVISDYNLLGSKMGLALLADVSKLRPSVRLVLISGFLNEQDADEVQKLGLVDRVIRKTSPMESGKAILEEVRQAAQRADEETDWVAFASASLRASGVDQDALDALDSFLQANRLSGA